MCVTEINSQAGIQVHNRGSIIFIACFQHFLQKKDKIKFISLFMFCYSKDTPNHGVSEKMFKHL